jgi:hypothetical protein
VEKRSKHFCNSTFWKPACFFAVCSRYLREICESDRSIKITEEEFERIRNALLVPRGNAGLSKLQAPNALLSERRTSKQGGGASRPKIHRFLEQFEPEQSYRVPGANRSLSGRTGCLPDLTRGTLHAMHVPDLSRNSYFGEPNFLRHTAGHGAPVNCAMAVGGMAPGPPVAALGRDAAGYDRFSSDLAGQLANPPVGEREASIHATTQRITLAGLPC